MLNTKLLAIIAAALLAIVGMVAVIERGSVHYQRQEAIADDFQKKSAVDPNTIKTTGGARY